MSVEEAYAILGLHPGADAEAIKEAHRRLMATAPRPRRLRLSRHQDQPRPRRAAEPVSAA